MGLSVGSLGVREGEGKEILFVKSGPLEFMHRVRFLWLLLQMLNWICSLRMHILNQRHLRLMEWPEALE